MEQQKLPNVTIALVLAILSFVGCCCTSGFGGLIFGGIALYLANKDEKLYQQNPSDYSNYGQLKTAKTVAWIGIILSIIIVAAYFYMKSTGMYDDMMEQYMEQLQDMQN
ncbi:DUF4190 domain-containing protein [Aurantibacter crassamenti]|uniref:CCC motif membrane protein n=1 Tax=Aurantibacter crassamenti TaxID=1837375 RepID=UPI00193A2974|nr:CCC motif membrane protein [Aurantibacter crassamenti]MBM1106658.1 DUF4190 domain-containing protein [Aurantibacter crassamenti]